MGPVTVQTDSSEFVSLNSNELKGRYPFQNFQYAKPGDYVGLIQNKQGQIVDFHITPDHHYLRDPRWRKRVKHIMRVVKVM